MWINAISLDGHMKQPIRSRWCMYRTLAGAFSRMMYIQTWSAVQLWIGAADSWIRTFLLRQTRSLWARAADSYRRWPMKERHSPQRSRIRFVTGVSLQTLQHQRAFTAGGPCSAKVSQNVLMPLVLSTSRPYFSDTIFTFS